MRRTLIHLFTSAVNSPIIAALIGATFGLALANIVTDDNQHVGPPRWALLGLFISAILSAVFVYTRLSAVDKTLLSLQDVTDLVRLDVQSGAMNIVVGLTENARVIRVVGRARQDLLASPNSPQYDYLRATEASIRSGRLSVYRRITGCALRKPFRDHLSRLLEGRRPGNVVELALVEEIDALISYQVFDTTAAIVGIETAPVPGIRDSTIVYLTHKRDIIEALVAHFDSAWAGLGTIADKAAFEAQTRPLS